MAYMNVTMKTDKKLQLLREPSLMSKLVFSGFVVGVIGVLIFGSESVAFKALIAFSSMIISSFIVDNYETLDINKTTGRANITRMHFCQYLMRKILAAQPYVSCKLSDIQDVMVDEQQQGSNMKMYRVVLVLESGIRIGITEVFTNELKSEHEKVADMVSSFIGICGEDLAVKMRDLENDNDDCDKQLENELCSSSSDDEKPIEDGFEKITQDEIDKIDDKDEEEKTQLNNIPPDESGEFAEKFKKDAPGEIVN